MNDVLKFGKKIFTFSVVAVTIVWSMGLVALVPTAVQAEECPTLEAGDLFTVPTSSAVYLVTSDMKRQYFSYPSLFNSWFANFDDVQNISTTCGGNYPGDGGVPFRAGSVLAKNTTFPAVYAILPGGEKAHISTADVAVELYGAAWESLIVDVADSVLDSYATASAIDTARLLDKHLYTTEGSDKVYLLDGGELKEVEGTLSKVTSDDVITVAQSLFDTASMSSDTVTESYIVADVVMEKVTVVEDGELTVKLSASTPDTDAVPHKASHVPYLTFKVMNDGDSSVTVENIDLERAGLGASSNFSKVWLEVGGVIVSNDQSVNSDDTVTLSPDYVLKAGSSVEFDVVATLNTSGANTATRDAFKVVAVEAGSADVSGLPISGNTMSYLAYDVGTADLDDKGTASEVKVGASEEIIGEFSVSFTASQQDKNADFESVRMQIQGDLGASDFDNMGLYEEGTMVSDSTTFDGDYVTFLLDEDYQEIEDGDTRRFEVRADIAGGDDAQSFYLRIRDLRDINVTDQNTGYGATVTHSSMVGTGSVARSMKTYTIDGGQFTITKDTSNPNNETVAKNTKDVVVLVAKVDLGQAVTVDGLDIWLHTDSNENGWEVTTAEDTHINADIERAELYVNDSRKATVTAVTESSATDNNDIAADEYKYVFDTTFELNDDDLIKLVIDLEENATSTDAYKFTFDTDDFDNVEYKAGSDDVASGDMNGTVTGNTLTIAAASATFTRNDGYSTDETFVVGGEPTEVMSTLLDAGTSGPVTVRSLNVDLATTTNYSYYTNFYLTWDGDVISDEMDFNSSGTLTFTGLNKELAASGQANVKLWGTLQNGITNGERNTFTFDVSDSTIEDAEGDDVSGMSDVTSAQLRLNTTATLTMSIDGNTENAGITVASGSADDEVSTKDLGTWKAVAENGAVEITDIYVGNTDGSSLLATEDYLVSKYELVYGGEVIASKAPASGKAHFDLASDDYIIVPRDDTERFTVRAVFNQINNEANTAAEYNLSVYAMEANTHGPGTALSSITGGVAVTDTTAGISSSPIGNEIMVYKSIPTLAVGTVSNSLANATREIFAFSIAADERGDVSWGKISLEVTGSCTGNSGNLINCLGATSSMSLVTGGEEVTAHFATRTASGIEYLDIFLNDGGATIGDPETISANSSKTYLVKASLSGFTGDNDDLSVRVTDNQSSHSAPAAAASASSNTFIWSDNSGIDESLTEVQWLNGYKTLGLDTDSITLSR